MNYKKLKDYRLIASLFQKTYFSWESSLGWLIFALFYVEQSFWLLLLQAFVIVGLVSHLEYFRKQVGIATHMLAELLRWWFGVYVPRTVSLRLQKRKQPYVITK
jgi:hypothetical protein